MSKEQEKNQGARQIYNFFFLSPISKPSEMDLL